ncbi:hypothetical protein AE925_22065, partial [Xanthomonas arboricola]|uniref:hypothetical protein n=1 Tax=Xanthomonas arboricola TaxID=56448 RepID=UPI0006A41603
CLDLFEQQAEKSLIVRAKQLYHDREEITVLGGLGRRWESGLGNRESGIVKAVCVLFDLVGWGFCVGRSRVC